MRLLRYSKAALEKFADNPKVRVFVLTLRSAAVGISECSIVLVFGLSLLLGCRNYKLLVL